MDKNNSDKSDKSNTSKQEQKQEHIPSRNWSQVIIFVLLALLVVAGIYIYQDYAETTKLEYDNNLLEQGKQNGIELIIQQLMILGQECRTIPVTYNNLTLTFYAIECIENTT